MPTEHPQGNSKYSTEPQKTELSVESHPVELSISRTLLEHEEVKSAVQKLKEDIMAKTNSEDYVTLTMHVNLDSAKADLIPVPTKDNLDRMKHQFLSLPKKVQEVIKNSIPPEDMQAVETVWDFLGGTENKMPLEDKSMNSKNGDLESKLKEEPIQF
ncbi:MAG: hypothetical protein ACREBU_16020 [Nitrososphaera sp.]